MTPQVRFKLLKSEEFDLQIGPTQNASLVRTQLRSNPVVRALGDDLRSGILTEQVIRGFIAELTQQFVRGQRFPGDTSLAALAVILESHHSNLADELLIDLARLKLPEMNLPARIARECLRHRTTATRTMRKTFQIGRLPPQEVVQAMSRPLASTRIARGCYALP